MWVGLHKDLSLNLILLNVCNETQTQVYIHIFYFYYFTDNIHPHLLIMFANIIVGVRQWECEAQLGPFVNFDDLEVFCMDR